jgi:hypothetical protein
LLTGISGVGKSTLDASRLGESLLDGFSAEE